MFIKLPGSERPPRSPVGALALSEYRHTNRLQHLLGTLWWSCSFWMLSLNRRWSSVSSWTFSFSSVPLILLLRGNKHPPSSPICPSSLSSSCSSSLKVLRLHLQSWLDSAICHFQKTPHCSRYRSAVRNSAHRLNSRELHSRSRSHSHLASVCHPVLH